MPATAVPPIGEGFRSLSEQVYGALLGAIAERRIRAGERLLLDDLSAQLKVSRTPIRDALNRLAAEGLVQPAGRRGFCVTFPSRDELLNLYDLRLMYELYAVEKGIGNLTPELLRRLEQLADEAARLNAFADPANKLAQRLTDRNFHLLLVGLAENPKLTALYGRLNIHIQTVRLDLGTIDPDGLPAINQAEHSAIVAALRAGDVDAARAAVRAHVENARARAMAALDLDAGGTLT